jgi:hypothetical protein
MPGPVDSLYAQSFTLRLLSANNAPLVLGFLEAQFKRAGHHQIPEEVLETLLERYLGDRTEGDETPANLSETRARNYLNTWTSDEYRYLRKVYSAEEQSFVYQLTRHSEKALQWLQELLSGERHGGHTTTESRFSRIFRELKELSRETNPDPRERIDNLLAQRDAIDRELAKIRETGEVPTLAAGQVKERLIDLEQMAEAFLADFRAIEDRFREQAAEIHRIHLQSNRSKGDIVAHALDADEALRESEQGRSYYGFRSLIRSVESHEELSALVREAARLAAEQGLDDRVFRTLVERLLLESTVVQDSYRKISTQLRRIVAETNSRETQRLLGWIGEIKEAALAQRDEAPDDEQFHEIEEGIDWNNLMELNFHEPREKRRFGGLEELPEEDDAALLEAVRKIGKPLDLAGYRRHVESLLEEREQIALRELLEHFPPTEGAVDLVGYLCIANEDTRHLVSSGEIEEIDLNRPNHPRFARLDRIIFQRS